MRSKRLSNISTQLPKCPTLFVDRTFGAKKFAAALRKMGFKVEAHDKHFKRNAQDEKWLLVVGEKNWRILTADQEMESLHHAEIVEANAGVFILSDIAKGETYLKWVEMVKNCEGRMRHSCCKAKRPFVGRISKDGRLYRVTHLKTHGRTEDVTAETSADAELYEM